MKKHLTDEALQAQLFNLVDEDTAKEFTAHLAECDACKARYEKLQKQFSALDLLREDTPVREELIADTMAQLEEKTSGFAWGWAAGIAAAVLFLWMVLHGGNKAGDPGLAKGPEVSPGGRIQLVLTDELKALRNQPPFAPGSNIELNVLPRRDQVQLTIYNAADLTLVRERRSLTLKKGWNWMQFMWANTLIDPTSLELEPLTHKDKVAVEQLVFPPRMTGVGRWLLFSAVSGKVEFEITYFTSGLTWRAFYMGTLVPDESKMRMQGYVRVANQSGEDYEQAQTRLVVGKVHILDQIAALAQRKHAYGSPVGAVKDPGADAWFGNSELGRKGKEMLQRETSRGNYAYATSGKRKEIKKQGLSEYFLYTIEGEETIPHTWAKRLPSFNVADIPVASLYKYDEERWGTSTIRFLSFKNDKQHELGETPIPNGQMRIFRQLDDDLHLNYVGGTSTKYIPVDEDVELNLGAARKVIVEPKLMRLATSNHKFSNNGDISGWDEIRDWKIVIRNTRTLPVKLEITRATGTNYWELKLTEANGAAYKKHDLNHARFEISLPPETAQSISYTLTTYHGVRENDANR